MQKKKRPVFIVFYYERGGGVGRKVKRLWSYFLHHVFVGVFQYVPGPPKHVLHLVWSAYVISTAVRTASKVAWRAQILGKTRPVSETNKMIFWRWDQQLLWQLRGALKKNRQKSYGIHHNMKLWTKNFTIPRDYEGGGGPLHSKRLWKRASFFCIPP